jgi:rod shape-determining protein MreD
MRLSWHALLLSFALSLLAFLLFPIYFPSLRLNFFAPFIILVCYRMDFAKSLLIAFAIGSLKDLYCIETRMGLYAFIYCLTTYFLWNRRQTFFEDQPITLPLMTLFFSIIAFIIEWLLHPLLGRNVPFTLPLLITDLLFFPLLDAIYAWLFFDICLNYTLNRLLPTTYSYQRRRRRR